MAVHREFIKAWRGWQRSPSILFNLKSYANDQVIQSMVLDLNHMNSSIYALGIAAIEGKVDYIPKRAEEELNDLNTLKEVLNDVGISADDKVQFEKILGSMQNLLIEMTKFA